jgi:formylglycine-generating enzyme required for sulfatase activity
MMSIDNRIIQASLPLLMHCPRCNHTIEDADALFCSQCGEQLKAKNVCICCGKRLHANARFCDRCGNPTDNRTPAAFWRPLYCSGSGSAILAGDRHFKCSRCGKAFLEQFRFNNTSTCLECGATEKAEPAAVPIEQQTPPPQPGAGKTQPATNIHYPDERDDFYKSRLKKLGVAESDWVEIPSGEFLMGSPPTEKDRFGNELQHLVTIKKFYLLKTPVTFAMFDLFCDELKIPRPPDEGWGRGKRPVINITYWSAMEYCIWLQKRTGWNIRLPTEAEWEYACRAGTGTPFWTGDIINTEQANFDGNYTYNGSPKGERRGQTTPVDLFPPNPWGLYDMHGNVWEWCASIYAEVYSGQEQQDAGCNRDNLEERVVRGGSWYNVPGGLRSASRNKMGPNYHYLRIGFRILREAEQSG